MKKTTDQCSKERRGFLRLAGSAVACAGAEIAAKAVMPEAQGADAPSSASKPDIPGYDWTKHHWAFGVDATKCIGCLRCVEACKRENDVPEDAHHFRTWVERYVYLVPGFRPRAGTVLPAAAAAARDTPDGIGGLQRGSG